MLSTMTQGAAQTPDAAKTQGTTNDIDSVRRQAILSSLAGFPFLLVYSVVWLVAGVASYFVPADFAPWLYVLLGMPATPVAILLERRWAYVPAPQPDPLLPLTLQLLFVQMVAFPAILLVWDFAPTYVPVAFASIVGAHFLPFQWVYRTRIYGVLGVAVSLGAFALAVLAEDQALHYTGFLVSFLLLIGAVGVRAHAQATWREAPEGPGRVGSGP
ncbi:MAG: DUF7010 family protein [Planctomycetota bacterium]